MVRRLVVFCAVWLVGFVGYGFAQRASLEIDLIAPALSKFGVTLGYAPDPNLSFRFYYQRRFRDERVLPPVLSWTEVTDSGNQYELELAYAFGGASRLIPRVGLSVVGVQRTVYRVQSCFLLVFCGGDETLVRQSAVFVGPSGGLTGLITPNISLDLSGGYAFGSPRSDPIAGTSFLLGQRAWIRFSAGISLGTGAWRRRLEREGK